MCQFHNWHTKRAFHSKPAILDESGGFSMYQRSDAELIEYLCKYIVNCEWEEDLDCYNAFFHISGVLKRERHKLCEKLEIEVKDKNIFKLEIEAKKAQEVADNLLAELNRLKTV